MSHSWGDNVFRNFLAWVGEDDEAWAEKHVAHYSNIAGPTLGVPKSVSIFLSGAVPLRVGWALEACIWIRASLVLCPSRWAGHWKPATEFGQALCSALTLRGPLWVRREAPPSSCQMHAQKQLLWGGLTCAGEACTRKRESLVHAGDTAVSTLGVLKRTSIFHSGKADKRLHLPVGCSPVGSLALEKP